MIRFIHGLLDGVIPIAKAIVSEISNARNIALGTSSIFVGIALGGYVYSGDEIMFRSLGPIMCGYLSDPDRISFLVDRFPIFERVHSFYLIK